MLHAHQQPVQRGASATNTTTSYTSLADMVPDSSPFLAPYDFSTKLINFLYCSTIGSGTIYTGTEPISYGTGSATLSYSSFSILITSGIRDDKDQMGGQVGQFLIFEKFAHTKNIIMWICLVFSIERGNHVDSTTF
jgi:hypothetical protein